MYKRQRHANNPNNMLWLEAAFQSKTFSHCKTDMQIKGAGRWVGVGVRGEEAMGEARGRQMPPLWPRHCGILIGSGHLVPT